MSHLQQRVKKVLKRGRGVVVVVGVREYPGTVVTCLHLAQFVFDDLRDGSVVRLLIGFDRNERRHASHLIEGGDC